MPLWENIGLALLIAYWIGVVVYMIADDRDPTTTLAWLFALILLPVVGLVLYIFLGRDWKKLEANQRKDKAFHQQADPVMAAIYDKHAAEIADVRERYDGSAVERIITAIAKENGTQPLPATRPELFTCGGDKFAALKRDMAAAQRFIHLQYFIWEHDELTAEIMEILLDRIANGVEVRVTYDYFGSLPFRKNELGRVRKAGGQVHADVTDLGHLNYRNHRKIAVIDGDIGYTGGMNVGQEYIDGGKKYPTWRDTAIRFTGPAVAELEYWFASRWFPLTGENVMLPQYLPSEAPVPDCVMIQTVAHGVEDRWESSRRTHGIAVSGATKRVWMQSPYFIPDAATYDALIGAALGGVEVRFMMTGLPDHKAAFNAAHTYWPELVEAGGHVYTYDAGFFHAKTLAIDSEVCAVGTMNMDIRSLKLHKELMAWVYDEEFTHRLEASFEHDLQYCTEITLADVRGVKPVRHFVNSASRLGSNIM